MPVALLVLRSVPAAAEDEFDIIRKNIVAQQPTPTISDAEAIQKQQQQNGSWYDVNYADSAISIWGPITHLDKLKSFCAVLLNDKQQRKINHYQLEKVSSTD